MSIYNYPVLYEKIFYPKDALVHRIVDKLKYFFPNKINVIIEFGCGTGIWSNYFQYENYYGIDLNKEMIKHSKECNSSNNKTFIVGDILKLENIKLPHSDLIFISDNTLNHFQINELSHIFKITSVKLLKPQGLIFFSLILKNDFLTENMKKTIINESTIICKNETIKYKLFNSYSQENSISINYEVSVNNFNFHKNFEGKINLNIIDANELELLIYRAGLKINEVTYLELPNQPKAKKLLNLGCVQLILSKNE